MQCRICADESYDVVVATRGLPFRVLELPWGFALAACQASSAIQVVARAA